MYVWIQKLPILGKKNRKIIKAASFPFVYFRMLNVTRNIQGVSGGIVNILEGGNMDYSE